MRIFGCFPVVLILACHPGVIRAASPDVGAAPSLHRSVLDREARIDAQTRIERVYYRHRLWPAENKMSKPPFETMITAAEIERKAGAPVRMSAALKKHWNLELTPAMLQAELERMERESKDRATLHELFAALGNDPYLIAETLARYNLVHAALRQHYARDLALHSEARGRMETVAAQVKRGADWAGLDATYSHRRFMPETEMLGDRTDEEAGITRLPAGELAALSKRLTETDAFREDETGWRLERKIAEDSNSLEMESLFIPKRSFDDWMAQLPPEPLAERTWEHAPAVAFHLPAPQFIPAAVCELWTPVLAGLTAPVARVYHTAVWTGSEMIIWGGYNGGYLNTGGRYNPATDSWLPTSLGPNVPSARRDSTATWTGTLMIIWGGSDATNLNTGGRYNPTADSWTPTSIGVNVPAGRRWHSSIWSNSEMIVWGGSNSLYLNTGGRYNPAGDSWTATSTGANVPVIRRFHSAIWTGSEMIVWGGHNCGGLASCFLNTGGRYAPAGDTWSATSTTGSVPAARRYHTAVWTGAGGEVIDWGGSSTTGVYYNSGGRYSAAGNSWLATSTGANVPATRELHTAIWTGTEMIVWGGQNCATCIFNTGGRYSPTGDSWIPTSTGANVPVARRDHTAIWTNSAMIVWGGFDGAAYLNSGGAYTPGGAVPGSPGNSLRGGKTATVDFNWAAVTGATAYNVKRCAAPCTPAISVATPAINSYSEPLDTASYFYAVEAANSCGATP